MLRPPTMWGDGAWGPPSSSNERERLCASRTNYPHSDRILRQAHVKRKTLEPLRYTGSPETQCLPPAESTLPPSLRTMALGRRLRDRRHGRSAAVRSPQPIQDLDG